MFRGTEIALYTAALNHSTVQRFNRFKGLANPAIAFPLDVGHLARCNISFEGAEATDAGFPSLQGNFVVAGRQRDSKSALLIRDERGHLPIILFHRKSGVRQRR